MQKEKLIITYMDKSTKISKKILCVLFPRLFNITNNTILVKDDWKIIIADVVASLPIAHADLFINTGPHLQSGSKFPTLTASSSALEAL